MFDIIENIIHIFNAFPWVQSMCNIVRWVVEFRILGYKMSSI